MNAQEDIDESLYDRIVSFVRYHTGWSKDLNRNTRIFHDLGIDGLDAYEMMEALEKDFEVNMSSFVIERHFGPESSFNPFLWIYWILIEREKLNRKGTAWKMVPVTVWDLYEAAKTQKFPDLSKRPAE